MSYLKPNFPVEFVTENSVGKRWEYVGPYSALKLPKKGSKIGSYFVTSAEKFPHTGTDPLYGEMTITAEIRDSEVVDEDADQEANGDDDTTDSTSGATAEGTPSVSPDTEEVEWVAVSVSLKEHPHFANLTPEEHAQIDRWKAEEKAALKGAFKFTDPNADNEEGANTLSALARDYARGVNLGIETYTTFVPVVRVSNTHTIVAPTTTTCGLKESPPISVPGYEFVKSADRGTRTGTRKWERAREWQGAIKVLIDKDNIYF